MAGNAIPKHTIGMWTARESACMRRASRASGAGLLPSAPVTWSAARTRKPGSAMAGHAMPAVDRSCSGRGHGRDTTEVRGGGRAGLGGGPPHPPALALTAVRPPAARRAVRGSLVRVSDRLRELPSVDRLATAVARAELAE